MNGIHDMGVWTASARSTLHPASPPSTRLGEGRVMAMNRALVVSKEWNIDEGRYGNRDPARAPLPHDLVL